MKNFNKYKTARERDAAFGRFCGGKGNCRKCNLANGKYRCSFAWLELEAAEEKLLPCPFCGDKTLMNCGHLIESVEHHWVDCLNHDCMYRSAHFTNRQDAIAAHNRVAKAVISNNKGE